MADETPRKAFPWMPSYVDEFFALAAMLTNEQLGAVMRLKHHAWKATPPCTLPDDDRKLATLSGLGMQWGTEGDAIRELFTPLDGRLLDAELYRRFEEQLKKHVARSIAGSKGGRPRKAAPVANGNQPAKLSESPSLQQLSSLSVLRSITTVRTENLEETKQNDKQPESSAFQPDPDAGRDWREVMREAEARGRAPRTGDAEPASLPTTLESDAESGAEETAHVGAHSDRSDGGDRV
jgi:uncharacterized protein YdaU (DUF1376 family)